MRNLLENSKPMYMKQFLAKYENELTHKRALYVVAPNKNKIN